MNHGQIVLFTETPDGRINVFLFSKSRTLIDPSKFRSRI